MTPITVAPRAAQGLQPDLFEPDLFRPLMVKPSRAKDDARLEQALRGLLLRVFLDEEPVLRLLQLTERVPAAHRAAWHLVTHTLLARRLTIAAPIVPGREGANAHTLVWALQRQWDEPVLAQRWDRLISRMSPSECRTLLRDGGRVVRSVAPAPAPLRGPARQPSPPATPLH